MATAAVPQALRILIVGPPGSGKSSLRKKLFGSILVDAPTIGDISVQKSSSSHPVLTFESRGTVEETLRVLADQPPDTIWFVFDVRNLPTLKQSIAQLLRIPSNSGPGVVLVANFCDLRAHDETAEALQLLQQWQTEANSKVPVVEISASRQRVLDTNCPSCDSSQLLVSHLKLKWMCQACRQLGVFEAEFGLSLLLRQTSKFLQDPKKRYFVSTQCYDVEFKDEYATALFERVAAPVTARTVESATKALWAEIPKMWPHYPVEGDSISKFIARFKWVSGWWVSFEQRVEQWLNPRTLAWSVIASAAVVHRMLRLVVFYLQNNADSKSPLTVKFPDDFSLARNEYLQQGVELLQILRSDSANATAYGKFFEVLRLQYDHIYNSLEKRSSFATTPSPVMPELRNWKPLRFELLLKPGVSADPLAASAGSLGSPLVPHFAFATDMPVVTKDVQPPVETNLNSYVEFMLPKQS